MSTKHGESILHVIKNGNYELSQELCFKVMNDVFKKKKLFSSVFILFFEMHGMKIVKTNTFSII